MKKDKKELSPEARNRLSIGQRIRHERQLRYMTQAQLSELLGISVSYLGALERGDRPVSSAMILRLHECLGLSWRRRIMAREPGRAPSSSAPR